MTHNATMTCVTVTVLYITPSQVIRESVDSESLYVGMVQTGLNYEYIGCHSIAT